MKNTKYQKQAEEFLKKTGTSIAIEFLKNDIYFPEDKEKRDIYTVILKRGKREYKFTFGQSIYCSGFYWCFSTSKKKNYLPMELIEEKNLKNYIQYKINPDFGRVEKDYIHYPEKPTAYDILASLEKYEIGTFTDFCNNFGYNEDSIKAMKVYEAVKEQVKQIKILYNDDEIKELSEIQ